MIYLRKAISPPTASNGDNKECVISICNTPLYYMKGDISIFHIQMRELNILLVAILYLLATWWQNISSCYWS